MRRPTLQNVSLFDQKQEQEDAFISSLDYLVNLWGPIEQSSP